MKKLMFSLLLLSLASCAQKQTDRYIICEPFFIFDEEGHRVNKFMDKNTNLEVPVSECDEVEVK